MVRAVRQAVGPDYVVGMRPALRRRELLDAIDQDGSTKCVHNAATGRELKLQHELVPALRRRRRAVVVLEAGGT